MEKRIVVPIALALIAVAGAAYVLSPPEPAEAGFSDQSLSELAVYATGDHPLNLRLMALDELRQKTDSGVESELAKIAKKGDTRIAIHAAAQLGKKKTSAAKAGLKSLVTDTKLGTDVRKAAMTAIAAQFKSASDLAWMKAKVKGDSKLRGYAKWLETNVYGK